MKEITVWGFAHTDESESFGFINGLRRMSRRKPQLPLHARMAHCRRPSTTDLVGRPNSNLVFGFPGSRDPSAPYVQRRAAEIRKRSAGSYATMDAHQILDFGLRTALVDRKRGVSPLVLGFLRELGICDLVITEGWGMQGHIHNAFLLEANYRPEPYKERAEIAYAVRRLVSDDEHPAAQASDFNWYAHVGDLHAGALSPPQRIESAFRPLDQLLDEDAAALGLSGLAVHVLNWRKAPLSNGIWGEVVAPIPVPTTEMWPQG